jgi:cytoskeletal protein RodZ
MERNVKIALGCGGAGCLGLIVLLVAGVLLYYFMGVSGTTTNRNSNSNSNRSSRAEATENRNDNSDANDNESSSSESSSSSSMSEDARHRLFHAASATGDADIVRRVGVKIGILKSDNTPTEDNIDFVTEHVGWVFRNTDFIKSIDTPEKARAYVNAHIND